MIRLPLKSQPISALHGDDQRSSEHDQTGTEGAEIQWIFREDHLPGSR